MNRLFRQDVLCCQYSRICHMEYSFVVRDGHSGTYSFVGTDIRFFEGILCSGTLLWLLYMVSFAMQISSKKYKNDVEIDADRKDRKSLISGLANISGLLALTIFAVWVIKSFVVILINVRFRGM